MKQLQYALKKQRESRMKNREMMARRVEEVK